MCYARDTHMEAASPLKLFEYSASGLPIVGSRLPSLTSSPDVPALARLVDTPDEAVRAVEASIPERWDRQEIERRQQFAANNSWDHRARQVLSYTWEALDR